MNNSTPKPSQLSRVREHRLQRPNRKVNLVVRLSEDEMGEVAMKAQAKNITRSEYCRGVILGHRIRDKTSETRTLHQNLIRGCGNLNQFQKYLNTYGRDDATSQKIVEIIDWFHELRGAYNNKEKRI